MSPKITGGELGSRKLKSPKGMNVRPTPGRVKESLFSILLPRIAGANVLDLFAGPLDIEIAVWPTPLRYAPSATFPNL